ncbi:coiled-coil domain-containing protein 38-like [Scyliorhinus canicula]|uniref:coiled-coil domain-containing protein 38-like n=1 Tax=Scyliorhinus canicula TaxID=7830 RepID=UPI0018F59B09|nr:coiled-coil domain-containing protein 38-like [Scyliorhinus canicula]
MEKENEVDSKEVAKEIKHDDNPMDEELYFKDPQEILDIFFLLEENILSLLQYCREIEEDIERVDDQWKRVQKTMKYKIHCMKIQVKRIEDTIEKVESEIANMKFLAKMFSWGVSTGEDEETAFEKLNRGLRKLHQLYFKDAKVPVDVLQTLRNIESDINRWLDSIDAVAPQKRVSAILKRIKKEKQEKLHEAAMARMKLPAKTKRKPLLELAAQREPNRLLGRKLMYRSQPDKDEKKDSADKEVEEEENDESFFFT